MKDSFVFFRSFYESVKKLDNQQKLEIYEMIFEYGLNENKPEDVNIISEAIFNLIKPTMDNSKKKYDAKVENGKKGGRPRKKKPNDNLKKPNDNLKKPNVTEPLTKKREDEDEDEDEYLDLDVNEDVNEDEDVLKEKKAAASNYFKDKKKEKQIIDYSLFKNSLNNILNFKEFSEQRKNNLLILYEKIPGFNITELIKKIKQSKFAIGKSWFTIDWILKVDNAVKILEGNYIDDYTNTKNNKPIQQTNYDQREYDDEFFDSLYDNDFNKNENENENEKQIENENKEVVCYGHEKTEHT